MKKILFVVTELKYFLSHRLDLAKYAKANGFNVYVAAKPNANLNIISELGFQFIPLNHMARSRINPLAEIFSLAEIKKIYNTVKPDVVHNIALKPVIYGSIVGGNISTIVNTLPGLGFTFSSNSLKAKILRPLIKTLLRNALNKKNSKIIVQNQVDAANIASIGVSLDKIFVIRGSGIDVNKFNLLTEPNIDKIHVAFVGRMLKDKGIIELIQAGKILHQKKLPIEINLYGDIDPNNPATLSYKQILMACKNTAINYKGFTSNINQIWQENHIAVLPSYREGIPRALLEAALCGRAIVTTDAPGCNDVVVNDMNGFLVPVKDSVELANAIIKLASDQELRVKMGDLGRKRVIDNFGNDIILQQTFALYNQ